MYVIFILALSLVSCVQESSPLIAAVKGSIAMENGRLVVLEVHDGLGGWGLDPEYTLVQINKHTASFCRCGDSSESQTLRVGDKLSISTLDGEIHATIQSIENGQVRVFVQERPMIIEPAPRPDPPPSPDLPTAANVPKRSSLVYSPYTGKFIDITGFVRGSVAYDPTTSTLLGRALTSL